MRFGTNIITPPFASNDNGQHRNFLITNEVPSGYYIVNVLGKFGSTLGIVYSGKMVIPGAGGPATSGTASGTIGNQHSVIRVVVRDGSNNCHTGQVFDPAISECIGNVTPPTHAIAAPTGGQACTAIQHIDPTYHVCVPLGRPSPPPGQPFPPREPGAQNCPMGFLDHVGLCSIPSGYCPPGTYLAPGTCEFNNIPPLNGVCPRGTHLVTTSSGPNCEVTLGPDWLHYVDVSNQGNANLAPPGCHIDPNTGASICNSVNPTPTAVSGVSGSGSNHNHHSHNNGGTSNNGGGSSNNGGGSGVVASPDNGGGGGPPVKGSGDNGGSAGPAPSDNSGGSSGGDYLSLYLSVYVDIWRIGA